MRKLFRFKYEPCNGTCYAPEKIFFRELSELTQASRIEMVDTIVKAHDKLCDNPAYSFGIDLDEDLNVFVGVFVQPGRVDTFAGKTLEECVLKLCTAVINTNIPTQEGQCNFGNAGAENLAEKILAACS
jgi:hypothetical protein